MNRIRPGARGTLVFDGDCAICSSSARLAKRLLGPSARVVPYQRADLAELGVSEAEAAEAVWWIEPGGRRYRGHEAIARALRSAGGLWRPMGAAVDSRALAPLSARVYGWVARNRHRLPGGTPACRVDEAKQAL